MVVKQGAEKPDISTVEKLIAMLENAKSIAYSDSASGTYIENELFEKLGVENNVQPKAKMIEKTPVGEKVASGEFEIGFQQVSELLPIKGVDFVERIPDEVQKITTFSAGVVATSQHPEEAKKLIEFLTNDRSDIEVSASGMDVINK